MENLKTKKFQLVRPPFDLSSRTDLAAAVHISVVSVSLALAGEGVRVRVLEDVLVSGRQGPAALLLLAEDQAGPQEAADCETEYSGHSAI